MIFSLHAGSIVEHMLQEEKVPLLFAGGNPAWMFSPYYIQKHMTPEGLVGYPVWTANPPGKFSYLLS